MHINQTVIHNSHPRLFEGWPFMQCNWSHKYINIFAALCMSVQTPPFITSQWMEICSSNSNSNLQLNLWSWNTALTLPWKLNHYQTVLSRNQIPQSPNDDHASVGGLHPLFHLPLHPSRQASKQPSTVALTGPMHPTTDTLVLRANGTSEHY